jgi:hypothetical protein
MTLTGHRTREVFDRYDIVNEADRAGAPDDAGAFNPHANRRCRGAHRFVVRQVP